MIFILTSCNEEKIYRIGVSQCSNDDWRKKLNEEINRELMFHPEAQVEIRSANDDNEKQIADIRYFIDNNFDIIIAAPNEADAITPILTEAYSEGIPVLIFDRGVNGENYTAWQGADNEAIGKAAAEYLLQREGPGAPVIEICGLKGSTPEVSRHKGFINTKGINVVASGRGNWNAEDAYRVTDSLLGLYPNIKAIYAHNDRMAIAASMAARERGLDPLVIGIDAAPSIGMKAVADSIIDATFLYPTRGNTLINTALAILKNEPYQRINAIPTSSAVDNSNIDILLRQEEAHHAETVRLELLKRELDDYWSQQNSQRMVLYSAIIITLLLAVLLFLVLRIFWQHRRHQAEMEAATTSKLAFFTNVSHDLRTPLTLISEPIEQLKNASNLSDNQKILMRIADKNIRILKRLINQILDFRKYENNKLNLHLDPVNFKMLFNEWCMAFEAIARQHDIDFKYTADVNDDFKVAIDVEKYERIFYNIVANAFKYTPDKGSIYISCSVENGQLILTVKDTGKGISEEDLPFIFDQFFQVDKILPAGSGIGLVLAKAFAELHGGKISVISKLGVGSEFTVTVPARKVDENLSIEVKHALNVTADNMLSELGRTESVENGLVDPDSNSILVIDDNDDIRAILRSLLSDNYTVITASNGIEGIRLAEKYVPNLIICDVMMPELDGLECCKRIKAERSTSHIPVLMLTACAMDEQRAQGYEVGADGYISKPFNAAVLKSRIKSLLENRKRIKNLWSQNSAVAKNDENSTIDEDKVKPTAPSTNGVPDIDNEFYQSFIDIIKKNMSNSDLNVDEIASSLNLGRSQLYRKIKALTNYSPNELLRNIRLYHARHLLSTTEKTISEIAYQVGFSTPAYFTKCYREMFDETPGQLREKLGKS